LFSLLSKEDRLRKGKNRMLKKKHRQKERKKESEESNKIKRKVVKTNFVATDLARLFCAVYFNIIV